SVFDLPLARRASDLVLAEVGPGMRVLEAGAGDRRFRERVEAAGASYASADPDPAHPHEWRDIGEAVGPFDLLFALELVEHFTPEEALAFLRRAGDLLRPGGRILVGTPDVFTPGRWHRDAGHRTPFSPWELGGFIEEAGFRVLSLHRAWNAPLGERILRRVLLGWVHRLTGADYAHSVVAIAERPAAP
ncbi:MAG: methyltransferase domain-containing protein, partial [Planctomycetaceae bacterium]|nr:methyltransferase domain-containing protein [Planctomycetaceae bacterium]